MSAWRIGFIFFTLLFIAGCHRHVSWCEPQINYSIRSVEKKYGVPNEIISKANYTWYGYVTKLQTDYPVKKNFSRQYPATTIGFPIPLAHTSPNDSFARYGCAVWFKADRSGLVVATKRTGKHCKEEDYRMPVGN
jgi:hypothetical protein